MKKVETNKFPHSAKLFQFCKSVLEDRYNGRVKVIDQDIGSILGYDPADCSHWKKGKKNIRSLNTLRTLATHLSVDENILVDLTAGRIDLDEALFELRGYGSLTLSAAQIDEYKKDYFRNPDRYQVAGKFQSFEELFEIKKQKIDQLAEQFVQKLSLTDSPFEISELVKVIPTIQFKRIEMANLGSEEGPHLKIERTGQGANAVLKLTLLSAELKTFERFLVLKSVFLHLIDRLDANVTEFSSQPEILREIHSNLFAASMLIPRSILKSEVALHIAEVNIVDSLSNHFMVSRSLMNFRLREVA